MFDKILIANRGEIACRVMRTAKRMGIRTVAVYSDADANAMHVAMADEAYCIGPAPSRDSYRRGDKILEVARRSGAQAIHPGYGFLSENADFAAACAGAGIEFIGPTEHAIRVMGSKAESKREMAKAEVPMVPGYHGESQSLNDLTAAAERIGYPVLVKASAGGGGKGMRIVRDRADLPAAIKSARAEAESSFGDDSLLLEKYLTRPRHVEIQVFADKHGHVVHLFERDCSIQRRHQKVIEEAPAPGLPDHIRKQLGAAAVAAASAIGYVGAGTVEFLYQDGEFYFIEMNTRLQVEHPVTEKITGLDLVEWQLRVAAGEVLPLRQDQIVCTGHAFEARLYAEDPARDFMPVSGHLAYLRPPSETEHIRVDTGVRQGDSVTIHYDPMIAKLIVWDRDRDAALRQFRAALADYQVAGMATNIGFLGAIAAHPAFAAVELDTGFIERHADMLLPPAKPASAEVLAFAALAVMLDRAEQAQASAKLSGDAYSPWHRTDGWRMNGDNHHDLTFRDGEHKLAILVHYRAGGWLLDLPGQESVFVSGKLSGRDIVAEIGDMRKTATVARNGFDLTVLLDGASHKLALDDASARAGEQDGGSGGLTAPMPGKIVQVLTEDGAAVERGQPLLVLEAMKMEHAIKAPADGIVKELRYGLGDQVPEGAELLVFEAAAEA